MSCAAKFNHSRHLPSFVERNGHWHHVAVTWTQANDGVTKIYWDGLLKATGWCQMSGIPLRLGWTAEGLMRAAR